MIILELLIGWTIVGLLIAVVAVPVLYGLAAIAITIVSLANMRSVRGGEA